MHEDDEINVINVILKEVTDKKVKRINLNTINDE